MLAPAVVKNSAESGKSAAITAAELAMAQKLVTGMSARFKPESFKDTYRADLMRRVQEKIKKKQTHSLSDETSDAPERPKAQVIDLMEALRNSIGKRGKTAAARTAAVRAQPRRRNTSSNPRRVGTR